MPSDIDRDRYLEKRAEELGLPTDPEAYQDGGLAEAYTCMTLGEAETLVVELKGEGIPAWVKAPAAAMAAASPLIFPILVPHGRLADAQRLLAEHGAGRAAEPEEADQEAPEEESAPSKPQLIARRSNRARLLAAILFLGFGVVELLLAATVLMSGRIPHDFNGIGGMIVATVIAVAALAIGMISLRAYLVSAARHKGEVDVSPPAPKEIQVEPIEESAEETPPPAASWSGLRLAAGIFLLIAGLLGLAFAMPLVVDRPAPLEWVALTVLSALSIIACVIGVGVMRVPAEAKT